MDLPTANRSRKVFLAAVEAGAVGSWLKDAGPVAELGPAAERGTTFEGFTGFALVERNWYRVRLIAVLMGAAVEELRKDAAFEAAPLAGG